jgi:two-component system sensor histidine kinase SenX3
MKRLRGARGSLAILAALIALLAALAIVQYRWSKRVAAADLQRENEHLYSAAKLFAGEYNGMIAQTLTFLQNDAWTAVQSHRPIASVPKLIGELYFLDFSMQGAPKAERLGPAGQFTPAALPAWIPEGRCEMNVLEQPLALMTPVYNIVTEKHGEKSQLRVLKAVRPESDRCFVARLDEGYLRDILFPQLIIQSFGATGARDYRFAVVSRTKSKRNVYGPSFTADLRQPFFSFAPKPPEYLPNRAMADKPQFSDSVFFVHREAFVTKDGPLFAGFLGPGIWELQLAHKGLPLPAFFEHARRRDFLLSLAVEALLVAAVIFIVLGAQRMQRLADQKMRFVAGVSHELRTPVSAISMLSRNQADGLVTGSEKVKQYGELIHQQSRRLNEMVEQTLQYAGIHSGILGPKNRIELHRFLQETIDARREDLRRAGMELETDIAADLPPVVADVALVRMAFDNLLNNAIKFGAGGGWIRITAQYSPREKEVQIGVTDRGPGIDLAEQAEIFEPFCRGRAAMEGQIPGSGLGLSLVRGAVEAHHGAVTLVSEPGRGSTFTLHLPA